jgi:hypothetical protein
MDIVVSRSELRRMYRNRKLRRPQHRQVRFLRAIVKHFNKPSETRRRILRLLQH